MPSLTDEIEACCRSPERLWFPGLAPRLTSPSEYSDPLLSSDVYGTFRWLQKDGHAVRDTRGSVQLGSRMTRVEVLPLATTELFPHLRMVSNPEARDVDVIVSAMRILSSEPSLESSVGALVRSIHVLRTDEGYDTSHSDPSIPFSIFVSIPSKCERDADLRVAESILHETMHLQLTLMERLVPMVTSDGRGYSPWQGKERPVQGLLHGLYVFAVIHQFMSGLISSDRRWRQAGRRRCREIVEEVTCLGDFAPTLSDAGRSLRVACLTAVLDGRSSTAGRDRHHFPDQF